MHVYDGLAGRRDHETQKTNPGLLPTLGKAASASETSKLLEFKTGNPDLTHRGKDLAPRLQRCGGCCGGGSVPGPGNLCMRMWPKREKKRKDKLDPSASRFQMGMTVGRPDSCKMKHHGIGMRGVSIIQGPLDRKLTLSMSKTPVSPVITDKDSDKLSPHPRAQTPSQAFYAH